MNKAKVQVIPFVISFAFFFGLSMGWNRVARLLSEHGISPVAVGFPAFILFVWLLLSLAKRGMMNSGSDSVALVPVNPQDCPWLDYETLAQLSMALEAIYFVPLRDFTMQAETGQLPKGFARLFHNPNLHCYAEVNHIPSSPHAGVECTISSKLEDGWWLSTTTRIPFAGLWSLRKPKSVWTSHPLMNPSQLMQAHLAWRENMVHDLGVEVMPETSFEAYEQRELETHKVNRGILRRKPMVVLMMEQALFSVSPKMEWRGEYPKVAAQRARSGGVVGG